MFRVFRGDGSCIVEIRHRANFAQPLNALRPSFLRMIRDILRFNARARDWVAGPHADATLGELLTRERFTRNFRDHYLVPMGAAIWSASERDMEAFPARFFVRFLANHGMLEPPAKQFQWYVVDGGSRHYVEHPKFPIQELRGAINLDAVGRLLDQPLSILGTGTAEEWQHIFRGCTFVTGVLAIQYPAKKTEWGRCSSSYSSDPIVNVAAGMQMSSVPSFSFSASS